MSLNEIHANSLLAGTFTHPREVLANPFLDTLQKRCILAAWASDAFTVQGKLWLCQIPGSNETVRIGDTLAVLSSLDEDDNPQPKTSRMPLPEAPIRVRAVGQTALEDRRRRFADIHP